MALTTNDRRLTTAPVLIVAYGNPLRSDDGLAWRAAEILRRELPPTSAEIVCVHQLAPELAESASRAALVIFIDAALNGEPGHLTCEPVPEATSEQNVDVPGSHRFTPAAVISLARQLYGSAPRALCISLTGKCFEHGESLSEEVANALPKLIAAVIELVDERSDR